MSELRKTLWEENGPVMDAKTLCRIFHYPSLGALQMAKARGRLPFRPISFEGRRGIFALTIEIADVLERIGMDAPDQTATRDTPAPTRGENREPKQNAGSL